MNASIQRIGLCQYKRIAFLLALLLGYILTGCQRNEVDPGFGPNGEPRLLQFAVPGIQPANIQIDQTTNQIVVTLPASFTDTSVVPVVELTPETTIDYPKSSLFSRQAPGWTDWRLQPGNLRIIRKSAVSQTTDYYVTLRAAGPLAFAPYTGSRTITMEPESYEITFPVINFRDSSAIGSLQLTNVATGQTRAFSVTPLQTCGNPAVSCLPLTVEPGFIEPGVYRIAVRKANGRQAELAGTISFQKGRLALSEGATMFTTNSLAGRYLRVYGYNLYLDSQLSIQLSNAAGEKFTAPLQDSYRGSVADFVIPAGLKAGYYYARLLEKGQPTSLSTRVVVGNRFDDLVIYNIFPWRLDDSPVDYLLTASKAFADPVVLKGGQTYSIPTSVETFAQRPPGRPEGLGSLRVQIRLTSVTNPSQTYTIPADTKSWWLFTIPTTIPLGRYQLVYQQVEANATFETLPLEREIRIE
ncbi:hypothetical protein [uncultured Spirosoma sp.]|uniref:hypothetical protein n=1 Tax=uncultured Spirosoma sp. TaxID=278208 RepID=UPI00258558E4|nr:hypothetical protein [uncultured Spirosoma sp.]